VIATIEPAADSNPKLEGAMREEGALLLHPNQLADQTRRMARKEPMPIRLTRPTAFGGRKK